MSELEELPSWAGRTTSGARPKAAGSPQQKATRATETAKTDQEAIAEQAEQAAIAEQAAVAEAAQAEQSAAQAQPVVASEPATPAEMPAARPATAAAPAAASAAAPTPPRYRARPNRRPLPRILLVLFGLLALIGIGAIGWFLAESRGQGTETTAEGGELLGSATSGETTDEPVTAEPVETETDAATDGTDGSEEASETEPITVEAEVDPAEQEEAESAEEATQNPAAGPRINTPVPSLDGDGPVRQAVFRGGQVFLQGFVPSAEVGEEIQRRVEAVVGPGNVFNEYEVDPSADLAASAPLFVEDVVLFEFNSVEVNPAFLPILDLGTLLLRQNPQASVTIVTRTDAAGTEETNLRVSTERAESVRDYWVDQGVDPAQIQLDPRGEEGASEDDDEQTAALQRRAEFVINDLLG